MSNAFSAAMFWWISSRTPRARSGSSRIESCTSKMAASSRPTVVSTRVRIWRNRSFARSIACEKRSNSAGMASSEMMRCGTSGTSQRSSWTVPTAIPGDAPIPTSFRFTRSSLHLDSALSELAFNELLEGIERLHRVRTLCLELQRGATLGGQHHHPHDTLSVDLELVADHGDVAGVLGGQLHDLRRRPGMQS